MRSRLSIGHREKGDRCAAKHAPSGTTIILLFSVIRFRNIPGGNLGRQRGLPTHAENKR
jgi:hypothetical protein